MVIIHPEYAMLILEVNDLKEQIANLIVERDMLNHYVCRDIEMKYMLKIGALEYKLIVAGNNYEKAVRKLEIISERIAKKMPVNMTTIDRKIKSEFKEKDEFEASMSEDIDFAIEMTSSDYFDYDILDEMNIAYFKLQKLYNPVFELNMSDEKEKMYKKIEGYYKKGNYKKLYKLAEKYNEDDVFQDEVAILKRLGKKYTDVLRKVQREVRKIKNSFPYNQKVILEDENLCRRKKDSLNREIAEVNVELKKVEKKIENKLKKWKSQPKKLRFYDIIYA